MLGVLRLTAVAAAIAAAGAAQAVSIVSSQDPLTGANTLRGELGPLDPGLNTISGDFVGECVASSDPRFQICPTDDDVDFTIALPEGDTVTRFAFGVSNYVGPSDIGGQFLDLAGQIDGPFRSGFSDVPIARNRPLENNLFRLPVKGPAEFQFFFAKAPISADGVGPFSLTYLFEIEVERADPPVDPVAPIPLPASAWLLLADLGALGWRGRR